ncbi:MAG: WXG100 family type VII secretion target [Bacillota bacterium]
MAQMIGLESGVLERAAGLVLAAKQDLLGLGSALTARLNQSGTGWRGSGAQSFASFHLHWSERHRAIVAALDGFEAALRASEALTQRTDLEQAQSFAGATAGLE